MLNNVKFSDDIHCSHQLDCLEYELLKTQPWCALIVLKDLIFKHKYYSIVIKI